jgi:hypothetical protein
MAYKLLDMAQARWRRLDAAHLLPLVGAGIPFVNGAAATAEGVQAERTGGLNHSPSSTKGPALARCRPPKTRTQTKSRGLGNRRPAWSDRTSACSRSIGDLTSPSIARPSPAAKSSRAPRTDDPDVSVGRASGRKRQV